MEDVINRICTALAEMFRTTVESVTINDPARVHDIRSSVLLIGHDPMDEPFFACNLANGMAITLGPLRQRYALSYRIFPKNSEYLYPRKKYELPGGVREMDWLERYASGANPLHQLKVLADEFVAAAVADPLYKEYISSNSADGIENVDDDEICYRAVGRRYNMITDNYEW